MMDNLDKLTNEVLDYNKSYHSYEYKKCYDTDEEAYNEFYSLLKRNASGILSEMVEDVNMISKYDDITDLNVRKKFDSACDLIIKLNKYSNDKKKNLEYEI